MNRPDLAKLTDDDLTRASSVGLFLRARKEAETGRCSPQIDWDADTLIFTWSDGPVCRFPLGRGLRGMCSCPANEICRHLIRSILWLRSHEVPSGPLPPAVLPVPPVSPVSRARKRTKPTPSVDEWIALDRATLAQKVGLRKWRQAERLFQEDPPRVVDSDSRQVEFSVSRVTILFPAGSRWDESICTCGGSAPCDHVVPALLALRGESAASSESPAERIPAPDGLPAWHRLHGLLVELLVCGREGVSLAWSQGARAMAIDLDKRGMHRPAKLLDRLADHLEDQRTGARPFRADTYRRDITSLWLEWEEKDSAVPKGPASSRRETAAGQASQPPRVVVGVGARGWRTDEVQGLTLYLQDVDQGEILSASTARPMVRSHGIPFADLAGLAILAKVFSARDLIGRRLKCRAPVVTEEGRLRVASDEDVELHWEGVDWIALAQRMGVERWDHLADQARRVYPSLLTRQLPEIHWLWPARWEPAHFDSSQQKLIWPLWDADGRRLQLEYDYRSDRSEILDRLEAMTRHAATVAVLARHRSTFDRGAAEPIALLHTHEGSLRLWTIDIDDLPTGIALAEDRPTDRPSTLGNAGQGTQSTTRVPVEDSSTRALARRVEECSAWLDVSLAVGLSGWSQEHLLSGRSQEEQLRGLALLHLAESLHAALQAPLAERPEAFGRLLIVHDLTRERVLLDEPWPIEQEP
jgi:hypothetical protein